jgi:hypothetical protein
VRTSILLQNTVLFCLKKGAENINLVLLLLQKELENEWL